MSDLRSIEKVLITGGSGMVGKSILNHSEIHKWKIFAPTRNELNLNDHLTIEKLNWLHEDIKNYDDSFYPILILRINLHHN